VPVLGVVAADLVLIEASFGLGGLEAFPAASGPGDADQVFIGGGRRSAVQVIGKLMLALAVAGQGPAYQQPPGPARRGAVLIAW
jgi:hypothetical protein